jgi:cytoskeleton protein RodZ
MVMHPAFCNGVTAEGPKIEITQEGLRSILNQIEADLQSSEVYRRTMAGLQTMLGEASSTAQILVKAVGREAVRLSFQQFAKQYKVVPVSDQKVDDPQEEEIEAPELMAENPVETESVSSPEAVEEISPLKTTNNNVLGLISRAIGETKPSKKLSKAQLAAQIADQERADCLRQIGQELKAARQARSLGLEQLHRLTLVPIHHIEALEAGSIEELPENIYIRGFIRRLANALELDGEAIASSLPAPDPVKSVVPSWYRGETSSGSGFQLNSMHLYLGYAALMAGAVGGLALMTNPSKPGETVTPEPADSSQATMSSVSRTDSTNKPGLNAKTGTTAGADIAPPEVFPY